MANRAERHRGVRIAALVLLGTSISAFRMPAPPSDSAPRPSATTELLHASCEPKHDPALDAILRETRSSMVFRDRMRTLGWYEMAEYFGNQFEPAVPPEIVLSLIHTESKGRNVYDRERVSYGLFQIHRVHDPELMRRFGARFDGLTAEQQFAFMMPKIAKAYALGLKKGLHGAKLASYVGKLAERPSAEYVDRYGRTYQALFSKARNERS